MIGFELVKGNAFEESYYEKLEEIRKVHKGVLKSEEIVTDDKKEAAGAEASLMRLKATPMRPINITSKLSK